VADVCSEISRRPRLAWRGRLAAALRRPIDGLPSRAIACVFAAAFFTSLAVAGLSTYSIGGFLRDEVRLNFPAILQSTAERIDLWLSLRRLDMIEFANAAALARRADAFESGGADLEPARLALREALQQLHARHPVYATLALLDDDGRELASAGRRLALDPERRRALAEATRTSGALDRWLDELDMHAFSAPLPPAPGRAALSLHGFVRVASLAESLARVHIGAARAVYVVGRSGKILVAVGAHDERRRHARELPGPGGLPRIEEYAGENGAIVVSSAQAYRRFGWTIVVEEPAELAAAPVAAVLQRILAANVGIAVIFSAIAVLLTGPVLRPIHHLYDAAHRIAGGEPGAPRAGAGERPRRLESEVGVIARAFHVMRARLIRSQRELSHNRRQIDEANRKLVAQNERLRRVNEELEQLSITDELTRLHNRRFFREHLPREMKRALRTGEPLTLVLFDIDDFKRLNDRYGHAVGDAVLRRVAEVMSTHIREMDLLARYGGEEFVLLASGTRLEGGLALAEKIRVAVAAARFPIFDLDGPSEVAVTVSAGVALFRGDERELFRSADRALYRAKDGGKDCVCTD